MDDVSPRVGSGDSTWEAFHTLAEMVYASDDFEATYLAVVRAAPQVVSGCDHASLMLRRGDQFVSVASSDDVAGVIDAYERELGEGPCLDAIVDESAYREADLMGETSWPRLTQRVLAQTPVRGMAGFRLRAAEGVTGALNLFSDTAGALTDTSVQQGIVLASFVNRALTAAHERQTAASLREGLESNREIGKAIGLMMAFHKISDQEAFELLRSTSQDMNLKLREVARRVVEHHNRA
jgi:hypothetical protein